MINLLMAPEYYLHVVAVIYWMVATAIYLLLLAMVCTKGRSTVILAIANTLSWRGVVELTVYIFCTLEAFNKI